VWQSGTVAGLVVDDVALLDLEHGTLRESSAVRIEDGRIVEAGPRPLAAGSAERLDGGRRVLMPGLIDAHVHVTITTMDIAAMARRPLDVLRSATVVNAALLQRSGEIGVIAPGARADLLLVDGDPLADLSVLAGQGERLALVMRGGEVVVRRGL
jgi:imidazolonepropionase-like amidohydrolase